MTKTISSRVTKGISWGIMAFWVTFTVPFFALPTLANDAPLTGYHYDIDSIDPIQFKFFIVGSEYVTALRDAASKWNDTAAPGYFEEDAWSFDPEIHVSDSEYAGSWWAATVFSVDGDNTYAGNEVEIKFDTADMASLNATEKKLVAEHELGHAYGLDEMTDPGHAHCMIQGSAKFNYSEASMPSAGDVAGVETIY